MNKAVVFASILLAGCSSAPSTNYYQASPQRASDAEVDAANQQSLRCLAQYASRLDDGISDVTTISRAAVNSCRRERENFFEVSTRGWGPLNNAQVMGALVNKDMEAATYYILTNRAQRR